MADWVGKAAFPLAPIVDRMAATLKRSGKLFLDETRAPVLDPGQSRTKTGYLRALARDDRRWSGGDPPGVVSRYALGRGVDHDPAARRDAALPARAAQSAGQCTGQPAPDPAGGS